MPPQAIPLVRSLRPSIFLIVYLPGLHPPQPESCSQRKMLPPGFELPQVSPCLLPTIRSSSHCHRIYKGLQGPPPLAFWSPDAKRTPAASKMPASPYLSHSERRRRVFHDIIPLRQIRVEQMKGSLLCGRDENSLVSQLPSWLSYSSESSSYFAQSPKHLLFSVYDP